MARATYRPSPEASAPGWNRWNSRAGDLLEPFQHGAECPDILVSGERGVPAESRVGGGPRFAKVAHFMGHGPHQHPRGPHDRPEASVFPIAEVFGGVQHNGRDPRSGLSGVG